jgi:hypothetical protein
MGNSNVQCNNCLELSGGDNPLFFLYNDKKYFGNYLCKTCYMNKNEIFYNITTKGKSVCKKCDNCKNDDTNKEYVKIYWSGKHNNKVFCHLCLNNKTHRNTYRK